jgi:hypothetical protein
MLLVGRRHLEQAVSDYMAHYDEHRPHRFLGQARPLGAAPQSVPAASARIRRLDRLGGLIHEYAPRSHEVDEFSASTSPLKSVLVEELLDVHEGDKLPDFRLMVQIKWLQPFACP